MTFEEQRQDYLDSLEWVSGLMAATTPAQLPEPTPCAEFNVRLLMGHLIGTARRSLGTAERVSTREVPHIVATVPDEDLAVSYAGLASQIRPAWSRLDQTDQVTAPWGSCTALEAARGFSIETITHGWDLAIATGQPHDSLDDAAERCLSFAAKAIPGRLRGVMYDEPVKTSAASSATERLANFLGHRRGLS
ncbi:MAG: TIGR03086 family metal-binding protein [Nocardioidaceae bacterium]